MRPAARHMDQHGGSPFPSGYGPQCGPQTFTEKRRTMDGGRTPLSACNTSVYAMDSITAQGGSHWLPVRLRSVMSSRSRMLNKLHRDF